MIDEFTFIVALTGVISFGYGIAIMCMLQRCDYCNKIILIHKVTIRMPSTYMSYFMNYHYKCYKLKYGETQIVS